jgi:hypothetical protein
LRFVVGPDRARRHRVVTSRVEGVATPDSPGGQPQPPQRAVNSDRFEAIGTAGWFETASRPEEGANEGSIETDRSHEGPGGRRDLRALPWLIHRRVRGREARSARVPDSRPGVTATHACPSVAAGRSDRRPGARRPINRSSATSSSAASCSLRADAACGLARTTSRLPRGSECRRWRIRCLNRRLTRFLTTAPPTALLTTKPTRGGPWGSPRLLRWATRVGRPARFPPRIALANSSPWRMRESDGSTNGPAFRRTRARVRLSPAGQFRRARKPRTGRSALSGGQLRAALAAAGGEDRTAGPRAHAQPEAVGLRATTVVRLESTLAHEWAPGLSSPAHGASD